MSSNNALKPSPYRFDLPSKNEIRQARALIKEYKEEIHDYAIRLKELYSLTKETTDSEIIADFKEMIQGLSAEMEAVKKLNAEQEAFIAPIRRLPAEIIALILVFHVKDNGAAPIALVTVCKAWHHIILGTPWMWNKIHIRAACPPKHIPLPRAWYQSNFTGGVKCDRYEQIEFALERSGVIPLDIRLETPRYSTQADWIPIMELLWLQHGHRCRHLELIEHPAFGETEPTAGWFITPTSLPLLESIEIESYAPSIAIKTFLEVAQQTSPKLHTMHINRSMPHCLIELPTLIRRIRHMSWGYIQLPEFVKLHRIWVNSARVETLAVSNDLDSPFSHISDRHYIRLHTLAMSQTRIDGIDQYEEQLTSLTHVILRHVHWTMAGDVFQAHSIRLPAVTHFTLIDTTYRPLSYFILPSLESLELYGCNQNKSDANETIDMIWNPETFGRSPCPSRIFHLVTTANDGYILAALGFMQDLRQLLLYYDTPALLGSKLVSSLAKPPNKRVVNTVNTVNTGNTSNTGNAGNAKAGAGAGKMALSAWRAPVCPSLEELTIVCKRAPAKDRETCLDALGRIRQARLGTASEMRRLRLVLYSTIGKGSENRAHKLPIDLN